MVMDAKVFTLVAISLVVGLGLYFFNQEDDNPSLAPPKPTIISEVQKIKAVQTNPTTGDIEYTLTAQSLTQNTDRTNTLNDVVMDWTPTGEPPERYTISAKNARLDNETGDFVFENGFEFVRHSTPLTIKGGVLVGNTKSKLLESQSPLTIEQHNNAFTAQGFSGDLNSQVYDFYKISIDFSPPSRQDKPLF